MSNAFTIDCWILFKTVFFNSATYRFWQKTRHMYQILLKYELHFRQSTWNIKNPIFGIHRIPQYHVSVVGSFLGWQIYRGCSSRTVGLWRPSIHPFLPTDPNEQNKQYTAMRRPYMTLINHFLSHLLLPSCASKTHFHASAVVPVIWWNILNTAGAL